MIWGDEAYSNVGDYDLSVGYIASQSNQSILSYELYYGKLYCKQPSLCRLLLTDDIFQLQVTGE